MESVEHQKEHVLQEHSGIIIQDHVVEMRHGSVSEVMEEPQLHVRTIILRVQIWEMCVPIHVIGSERRTGAIDLQVSEEQEEEVSGVIPLLQRLCLLLIGEWTGLFFSTIVVGQSQHPQTVSIRFSFTTITVRTTLNWIKLDVMLCVELPSEEGYSVMDRVDDHGSNHEEKEKSADTLHFFYIAFS